MKYTPPPPKLLSTSDLAELLGLSISKINKWRLASDGPPYIKLGARCAYDPADVAAWLASNKRRTTAESGGR
jgi:predicted DNA-binding transcriptional regulator AlpA